MWKCGNSLAKHLIPPFTHLHIFSDGQPAQTHVAAPGESVLDVALNWATSFFQCGNMIDVEMWK